MLRAVCTGTSRSTPTSVSRWTISSIFRPFGSDWTTVTSGRSTGMSKRSETDTRTSRLPTTVTCAWNTAPLSSARLSSSPSRTRSTAAR